ncbi:hypothetical protein O3Q51_11685 [Cryomorphaceae bacterium 1068]|nr:hypothetical protein [Cryomorphaceae bacterium 1068]
MGEIEFINKAEKHIVQKDVVKVEREFEGEDLGIYGFLLGASSQLLFVQVDYDFQLDGYAIIPAFTVSKLRCNKTDRFHKEVLKKEGIFERDYGCDSSIDLTDWPSVFKSLKAIGHIVSIEDEEAEETDFVIGRIVRVNKKSVSIQYFDGLGQLDSETTRVYYENITIVNFNTRYIRTYSKYLKEPKKKDV